MMAGKQRGGGRHKGLIFSLEIMFAVTIAIIPLYALESQYAAVGVAAGHAAREAEAQRITSSIVNMLVFTPGGTDITAQAAQSYGLVEDAADWGDTFLLPCWQYQPNISGQDISLPGLAAYDTCTWTPVAYVLNSDKVAKLDKVADYISQYVITSGQESVWLRVEWYVGGQKKSVPTDGGFIIRGNTSAGGVETTRSQAVYYLDITTDPSRPKVYFGVLTVKLMIAG